MNLSIDRLRHRLAHKTIFLSASIPSIERQEEYQRVQNAAFEIDQAVISLTRAVLSESGRIVFGAHPSISPLVAMVAAEYREPRFTEGDRERQPTSIRIYQSHAFEDYLPPETLMMYQLGYAEIVWSKAADGEKFNPEHIGTSQCPMSLLAMRQKMIKESAPVAMVCIGGMDGVEQEAQIFREFRHTAPIFVLEKTGGAAHLLPTRRTDVRVMDTPVMNRIRKRRSELPIEERRRIEGVSDEAPVVPYPLIMQMIVDEIAEIT